jgi:hypothetical protein
MKHKSSKAITALLFFSIIALPTSAAATTKGHWVKNCIQVPNPNHLPGDRAPVTVTQCDQAYVTNGSKGHWEKNCTRIANPNFVPGQNQPPTVFQCRQVYVSSP